MKNSDTYTDSFITGYSERLAHNARVEKAWLDSDKTLRVEYYSHLSSEWLSATRPMFFDHDNYRIAKTADTETDNTYTDSFIENDKARQAHNARVKKAWLDSDKTLKVELYISSSSQWCYMGTPRFWTKKTYRIAKTADTETATTSYTLPKADLDNIKAEADKIFKVGRHLYREYSELNKAYKVEGSLEDYFIHKFDELLVYKYEDLVYFNPLLTPAVARKAMYEGFKQSVRDRLKHKLTWVEGIRADIEATIASI